MNVTLLDAKSVLSTYDMHGSIEELAKAFAAFGRGQVESPLRDRFSLSPVRNVLLMSSLIRGENTISLKIVGIYPDLGAGAPSVRAMVFLVDGGDGSLKAIVDGATLTSIRTGAVSGLSCRYLAKKGAASLGIIGAGGQAFHQVEGIAAELRISKVKIFSRTRAKSKLLADRCNLLGLSTEVCDGARECAGGSDVLVTATTSPTPVLEGPWVSDGTHVISIGAYTPDTREVDTAFVSRASVYVDSVEAAMGEAGDILIPIKEGAISKSAIKGSLSDLVLRKARGRNDDSEVTFFKSVGLAFEDNAAGWQIYRKAVASGAGRFVEVG